MNGAMSNICVHPGRDPTVSARAAPRRLRRGARARAERAGGQLVRDGRGARADRRHLPHLFHELSPTGSPAPVIGARRALHQAARADRRVRGGRRWTAERYNGGRYRIVPNGVDVDAARPRPAAADERLGCCSSAAPRSARGCRCCCARSRRCGASACDARLTVAGATREEVEPYLLETEGVEVLGPRDRGGEVAPAARGRPAVRAVARRRELRHGPHRGVCVRHAGRRFATSPAIATCARAASTACSCPPGDAGRARRGAARPRARPRAARAHGALRHASARSASRGRTSPARCSERLRATRSPQPQPGGTSARRALATNAVSAPTEPGPRVPPAPPALARARAAPSGRRRAARVGSPRRRGRRRVAGIGLTALALERIGHAARSATRSWHATPFWVLFAFALMCASMLLRAESWHAILRAALPGVARAAPRRGARRDDRRADVRDAARRGSASPRAR